jgi:sigma-B regulation protein RsbU (phosphoserine phosphatase)
VSLLIVVDDEELVLKAVTRELAEWASDQAIEIVTFSNPFEALEMIDKNSDSIDLLLSDARMPQLAGSELLGRVKKSHPAIVTFLFTGYADLNEVVSGVRAGIFGIILKPWNTDYLIGELEKGLSLVRLAREHRENVQRMESDLFLAGQLQHSLLEFKIPSGPQLRFSMKSIPADQFGCSGDYADIFDLGGGAFILLVGDVAGHGVSAALVTGILKAIIYADYIRHHQKDFAPAPFLAWLNERLGSILGKTGMIVTFACLYFQMELRHVTASLAGHPSPLVARAGKIGSFHESGAALGFLGDVPFPEKTVGLQSGDTLWVYTDGLVEVGGHSSKEGIAAIAKAIVELGQNASPDQVVAQVLKNSGASGFEDDVTLVKCDIS